MAQITDYSKYIKAIYKDLENRSKNSKKWNDDNELLEILEYYKTCIWSQIHKVLAPLKTPQSEKEIRDIIGRYVIGFSDKKKNISYIGVLDWIEAKLAKFDKETRKIKHISAEQKQQLKLKMEIEERYKALKDDFMAIASFRSLKHFVIYMQKVFNFKLWEETMNCFGGFWYYSGRMVLDKEIVFIEKQCPTGFGKSVSDAFLQAWIFGININKRVFKVCGNDKITEDCFNNVVSLMVSKYYAKVFPYYEQFNCKQEDMFEFCARKDLVFKIKGSVAPKSLLICTKLSDTNGVRCDILFLDDITQRKDMANIAMHNKDIHSFTHEWYERKDKDGKFQIIASGTTYSQFDILSHLRRKGGGENAVVSPVNKYTSLSRSDLVIENGISVFVCVPLLDYDTDESTYPQKITTTKARKKREDNPEEFWAMDMQRPLPPDGSPFYFTKLRQYTTLPQIGENGRLETCMASLDTKRRGKDYLSMPIFFEATDPENPSQTVFYLKDWLYDNRPMKDCIPLIVTKVITNNITRLYVERNTEECIETLIQDKLKEQGYASCVIEEVYSTEPKDRRIMSAEGDIKSKMVFPQYNMYAPSTDIGKALLNVYGYSYEKKTEHDDAPDSLALFAKKFISKIGMATGTIKVIKI